MVKRRPKTFFSLPDVSAREDGKCCFCRVVDWVDERLDWGWGPGGTRHPPHVRTTCRRCGKWIGNMPMHERNRLDAKAIKKKGVPNEPGEALSE